MVARPTPPFRADHVGSLLRPPKLLAAREKRKRGEITPEQLKAIEDEAIRDVVRLQEDLGLKAVTDGEFRRTLWHMDFLTSFAGVKSVPGKVKARFHTEAGEIERTPSALAVIGKLGRPKPIFVEHFKFLKVDRQIAAQANHPFAFDRAFPRRARCHRQTGLSHARCFLRRSCACL